MKNIFIVLFSIALLSLSGCDGLLDGLLPGTSLQSEQSFDVQAVSSGIVLFYKIEFKDDKGNVVGECVTSLNPTSSDIASTVVNLDVGNVVTIALHSFLGVTNIPVGDLFNSLPGGSPVIALQINPLDLILEGSACFKLYMRGNTSVSFEDDNSKTEIPLGDALCISLEDLGISSLTDLLGRSKERYSQK